MSNADHKPSPKSIKEIVFALGGTNNVAKLLGVAKQTVSSWASRSAIPAEVWADLLEVCRENGVPVTADLLVELHRPLAASAVGSR